MEAELNGADQIICATGFKRGYRQDALLERLVREHELETAEDWIVLAPDSTVPALTDSDRTLALGGIPAQWAFPAADTPGGGEVRGPPLPTKGEGVSYTLRGRLESRLAAALAPLLTAIVVGLVVREWWPFALAALMIGVGAVADVAYHRLFRRINPDGWRCRSVQPSSGS